MIVRKIRRSRQLNRHSVIMNRVSNQASVLSNGVANVLNRTDAVYSETTPVNILLKQYVWHVWCRKMPSINARHRG